MWEMIVDFNLLPTKEEEPVIVTAHLAEDPGGFVEATLKWRQRTQDDPLENNVSDKPFGISLREETISAPGIPPSNILPYVAILALDLCIEVKAKSSFSQVTVKSP